MIARTEKTRPESRLNPFAFPSDTDFRFVMLITATISAFSIYRMTFAVLWNRRAARLRGLNPDRATGWRAGP